MRTCQAVWRKNIRTRKIAVYSTGNVYPFTPVFSGGADESTPPARWASTASRAWAASACSNISPTNTTPLFSYTASTTRTTCVTAYCLRSRKSVLAEKPIDLRMGHVNVIWQGDANEMALRSFHHCSAPAKFLNITGPETAPVRWIAEEFGKIVQKRRSSSTKATYRAAEQRSGKLPAVRLSQNRPAANDRPDGGMAATGRRHDPENPRISRKGRGKF